MWDWLRRKLKDSPKPEVVEVKGRELERKPVLTYYPIQHLNLEVMGMREAGAAGAPGFLKLDGDTLTIVVWDTCLLTPLQREVGFAVTYEMKKKLVREVAGDLAEEIFRRPSF